MTLPITEPAGTPLTIGDVLAFAPGLPAPLAQIVLDEWIETGDFDLAVARMRQDPSYDEFFPGNRRADGSLRHNEATYLGIINSFRQQILGVGVNPDLFEDQFVNLVAGEVSPIEFAGRVDNIAERVLTQSDAVREFFAQVQGIDLTDAAIIAGLLDPNINDAILNRQITVAELGAEATIRNLDLSTSGAQRLFDFGVTRTQASQLFTEGANLVPVVDDLARRHLDPDSDFDLTEFLEGFAFGDPLQRRRIQRLLSAEAASFTAQGQVAGRGEQLTGLEQQ